MRIPVAFNDAVRYAEPRYIGLPDFGFREEWRQSLGNDPNPLRADAVDFAALACKRFKAHSRSEIYAREMDDIGDHIRNNPHCEVANFVALTCDWFPESRVLGVAHFRR